MSFDRTGLPHGYFFDGEEGDLILLSDYTEDQVDASVGIRDRAELVKIAWADYNSLDEETKNSLED
jgi:hypothetical protein